MLRIRSARLLSGASAIAILTAMAAGSAQAAPAYTGPFITPPITNDQPASVTITTNATIDRNGGTNASQTAADTNRDSFFNGKNMSAGGVNLLIQDSYLTGDIENTASMTSTAASSIFIGKNSQIGGRLFNSGTVLGLSNGVVLQEDSTITEGFFNTGSITGTIVDAFHIDTSSELFGGLLNTGLMAGGNDGIGVNNANVDFFGGINNSGTVTALGTTAGAAINWGGHNFTGGLLNTGTIQGLVQSDGIRITAGTLAGDFNNQGGTIIGTGAAAAAFNMSGGTFTDDLINTGVITGANAADGFLLSAGTFSGAIYNNAGGTIQVLGFGTSTAVHITGGTFSGGIHNSGLIDATSAQDAIRISGGTFQGGISNSSSGIIRAESTAISVTGGTFAGGITNQGNIFTFGSVGDGIHLGAVTFTGSIDNSATINAAADGIELAATTFSANIDNTGSINARNGTGIYINGVATVSGFVRNAGSINASLEGINVALNSVVTGNVVNDTGGTITAGAAGINIGGTVNAVINNGVIDPVGGILVFGTVTNGITNTNTIIGTTVGIGLNGETGTTSVLQTAGLLRGNSIEDGSGTVADALQMNNAHANLFRLNGGVLDGNVVANNTDNMWMVPLEDTAVWLRGTGTNLNDFNTGGERGTQILGAAFRGDASGVGIIVGANQMEVDTGRTYLDDNTRINLVNGYTANTTDGTVEFYLTSVEANHAIIAAGGAIDTQRENIEAFVDGTTFGSIGGDTFNYLGVMTGASTNGTDGAIDTNSLFFEGKAIFNPTTVDIRLTRLSFFDALVLPGLTQNEASVGAALDNIYNLGPLPGGYGPDFAQLFNYLLSLGVGDEAAALFVYNEISGEEHAQLQQTTLDILNPFNTFMGQRLDEAKASMGGVGFANNTLHQIAQASAVMMNDASPGVARGDSGVSIWGRGYGQTLNVDGDPEAPGYDQNTGGAAGGVDFAVGSNGIAGFALGWSNTDVDFDTPGDKASVDSFQVGAYGSYGFGRFYIDAEAAGAFHDLSTTRLLNLPSPPGGTVAGANYDARAFSASGEFGAVWHAGSVLIQPNAGLMFTDVNTDAFVESGAGDFNLIVNESDATSLASSVGLRAATQFKAGGMTLMPELSGAWRHEFDDDRQTFSAAFPDDPTSTFNIISSKISADSALVGAGLTAGLSKNFEIFVNYNGLLNQDVDVHNGSAGLRATW